jgi:hypothetical protein
MLAEFFGVYAYAAFGSPEWYVGDGAFPSHKHRKRCNFIDSYAGSVADSTLEGPASIPMLNTHAVENVNCPIVHANVYAYGD